ncbi:MAG: GGDEF domain-containing protein [Acidimicrobiales bacterium]
MSTVAAWTAQQLAEFSTVFDGDDDERRLALALDRVVESFDAEFAAVVVDGVCRRAVGLDDAFAPVFLEVPLGTSRREHAAFGEVCVSAAELPLGPGDHRMVVGRVGDPLSAVEITLLRSMARNLAVALELHEARAAERRLHDEIAERSRSNASLVASLSQRQRVLDHQFRIQRAITERAPIMSVLDAITTSAAELLPDSIIGLLLVESGSDVAALVATVGPDGALHRTNERRAIGDGVAGRAIVENDLVVADDYATSPDGVDDFVSLGVTTAMASPVRRNGLAVGSLVAMSWLPGRRFSEDEQHLLQSLAEHGSLAFNDASAIEVIQRSLERAVHDSHHDQLTGLANRKQAIGRLEEWAAENSGTTVIFIDIDRFKAVNDAYGHSTGDEILRNVARRLTDVTRVDDLVARLSGDEFLVIARSPDEYTATDLATRIADSLRFTTMVGFREIRVTASVGCARHIPGETADDVVANADLAMYRAKDAGGGQLVQFDGAMRDERTAELTLERELRFAIEHDEFEVYFQPVVDLASSRLIGAEALIRWNHPTEGMLSPGRFVEAAEAAGIIHQIDAAALRCSVRHLRGWERDGLLDADFRISVNVSARQFQDQSLVHTVAGELVDGVSPGRLWLEITETAMMRDVEGSLATMQGLRDLGVHLSVDDFGTGWSSLAYLKQFPVEALKIDQSFVAGLCVNADDSAIVEATIQLAAALGLSVIAEGVETRDQADELRRLGCRSVQGYLYARPLAAAEFAQRWLVPFAALDVGQSPT